MFELADQLLARLDCGERLAVATAVSIEGSAPHTVGTSMAVTESGAVIGSISGGCVEGAVYELCSEVLTTGIPQLEKFGFDEMAAFAVGLSCGGRIEVLVRMLTPIGGESCPGDAGRERQNSIIIEELRSAASGRPAQLRTQLASERLGEVVPHDPDGEFSALDGPTFTEDSDTPPRFIIFGAMEYSVALCRAASVLGYRVTVCDARPVFATAERFPAAADVVVEWPPRYLARARDFSNDRRDELTGGAQSAGAPHGVDGRTVIAILSHDDRFDTELIGIALGLPVGFVGAMGSRSTHERRVAELVARETPGLDRLHSPIGLDLGASSPEETAISILAEVLRVRHGATAEPLMGRAGSIHRV